MENNPQSGQQRPADVEVEKSVQSLGSRLRLIAKSQISLWKALVLIMFVAGFAAALTWSVSEQTLKGDEGVEFSQSEAALAKLPDLVAAAPAIASQNPDNDGSGTIVTFKTKVTNQGLRGASTFSNTYEIDYNSRQFNSREDVFYARDVIDLLPREWEEVFSGPIEFGVGVRAGTHAIRLCTDIYKQINESNETNNCGPATVVTFQNTPPPPRLPDLTVEGFTTPHSFTPGQSIKMSGKVCNRGLVSTSKGGTVQFLDDSKTTCPNKFPVLAVNACSQVFQCSGVPLSINPYYAAMFIMNPGFQEVTMNNNFAEAWIPATTTPTTTSNRTP